jgi:hypothetical protein
MAAPVHGGPTYIVQVSKDDGKSWLTVGMGLKQPQLTIDRGLLSGTNNILVKVIATNGVQSETSTKTFSVEDL